MHALAKILARHAGREHVEPGEIVQASPDFVMMHDRGIGRVRDRFNDLGVDGEELYDPSRVVVVYDHYYPPPRPQDAESQRLSRIWMDEKGITNFHKGEGIAHVVMPEQGYSFPGALVVGTDSHTTTNSALGCLAMGLGHTDVLSVLLLGSIWLRVPEVMKFHITGHFQPGVSAKDVILLISGTHGEDVCLYRGAEFAGPTVEAMHMDGRLTLANLAVDIGAKTGYITPDEVTWEWMEGRRAREDCDPQHTDSDHDFIQIIDIDVTDLKPLVALPHTLSNVEPAEDLARVRVDEAVLGTCTGGRLDDFRQAAAVLKGRQIHPQTRMVVNPGSLAVYKQAMHEGLIDVLVDAGAVIGSPGCGPCMGCHPGMVGSGEVAISSTSRNFSGRMGSPDSDLYVSSAATVAASAVAGHIADPREFQVAELVGAGS